MICLLVVSYRVRAVERTPFEGARVVTMIVMPIWDPMRTSPSNEGFGRCTMQQSQGLVLLFGRLPHMAAHIITPS